MTVVPFSLARFTPADLAEWNSVALPKLDRGLWESVTRSSGPDFDRLVVHFPNLDRPVFRFERDRRGGYRLLFNDRRGWYEIGSGDSAGECLSVWKGRLPRSPQRQPEDASTIA
ncbi:hypothetical protein [Rhodospirillum centenum]|uniref:Uncharacterized protein n=1 Tax=Rhodospirillum centenum (strain ATCC 51521 / SW) TaxID=414684 RepID=B6IPD0_RHOCS|nr:hypothetical protein [Rhodospirillum centenum]ACI99632.1 hypothetical protein RC1_2245 [Rhodospirillum centenum SW]